MNTSDDFIDKIICGDCLNMMKEMSDESVDLICTDPPYGISFMAKKWDTFSTDGMVDFFIPIWKECLRVLKPGAFAFVMCSPRQDVLMKQTQALAEAGFNMGFSSIYWAYASGFPKAGNIGKMVDKRMGNEREIIGVDENSAPDLRDVGEKSKEAIGIDKLSFGQVSNAKRKELEITKGTHPLEGSYCGFQPKPAVEIILVCMKLLSEKTYVDQALKNGKGCTWLDDCRIPYEGSDTPHQKYTKRKPRQKGIVFKQSGFKSENNNVVDANPKGRFSANLLVNDDVLNDGRVSKSSGGKSGHTGAYSGGYKDEYYGDMKPGLGDSGSFSRYFDLDKWAVSKGIKDTFPFLITPKASKAEKNRGLEHMPDKEKMFAEYRPNYATTKGHETPYAGPGRTGKNIKNNHPTVKPIKLMSYLITLGSRPDDVVLDPFCGSGTTCIAAKQLNRKYIGIDREKEYCEISEARLKVVEARLF